MFGILCFGDSITWGRGELPNTGWVGRLKDETESETYRAVYNLGIPGETTSGLLRRLQTECAARIQVTRPGDAFLILIAIGMNDARWIGMPDEENPQETPEGFKDNVQNILKIVSAFPAKVAVIGFIPVDEKRTLPYETTSFVNARIAEFNAILEESTAAEAVPFLNLFTMMKKRDWQGMLADGLHPGAQGYEWIFQQVKAFLRDHSLAQDENNH